MVNCDICKEKIGFMNQKHNLLDEKENSIIYCEDCYSHWQKKEEQRVERERKIQLNKILAVNHKWEYLVKKIVTSISWNIKIQDDELQTLGQEGWELVNVALVNRVNMFTGQEVTAIMTFKRRVP